MKELANDLLDFVEEDIDPVPERVRPFIDGMRRALSWLESTILTRPVTRWLVIISTALVGLLAFIDLITLLGAINEPAQIADLVQRWMAEVSLSSAQESLWFAIMTGLKGIVGLSLLVSLIFFIMGKDSRGVGFALAGLLLSITVLDVLLFYFHQFFATLYTLVDFALLAVLNFYNNRYL
jgi:hypothetical protein